MHSPGVTPFLHFVVEAKKLHGTHGKFFLRLHRHLKNFNKLTLTYQVTYIFTTLDKVLTNFKSQFVT